MNTLFKIVVGVLTCGVFGTPGVAADALELADRFLVKHGILTGHSIVQVPDGVAAFEDVDFDAFD